MKAAVLTGIRQVEIRDVPEPKIEKDNDVLLKVEVVGICGSDVHYYETGRIGSQIVQYPFIMGHECSATVKTVGDSVTRIKVGDKVVVDPAVSCSKCDQCKKGRENTCYNLHFLGTPKQGDGCLCEYIVMPQENCLSTKGKMPGMAAAITLEQAALCEPFTIGVYSVKRSQIFNQAAGRSALKNNTKVVVLGCGPIGLSCMIAARAQGVETVYMTDKLDYRVRIAQKAGAIWAGNPEKDDIVKEILRREPLGVDIVFECAGQQETLDEAVELLEPGGRLILVGIPRFEQVSFCIDKLRRKELSIINVRRQIKCTQTAIDLIASGKVDVDFMITHRFKLEQTKEAFDLVAGYCDGVVKALIKFGC